MVYFVWLSSLSRKLLRFQCNKLASVGKIWTQARTTLEICCIRWQHGRHAMTNVEKALLPRTKKIGIPCQLLKDPKHKGKTVSERHLWEHEICRRQNDNNNIEIDGPQSAEQGTETARRTKGKGVKDRNVREPKAPVSQNESISLDEIQVKRNRAEVRQGRNDSVFEAHVRRVKEQKKIKANGTDT